MAEGVLQWHLPACFLHAHPESGCTGLQGSWLLVLFPLVTRSWGEVCVHFLCAPSWSLLSSSPCSSAAVFSYLSYLYFQVFCLLKCVSHKQRICRSFFFYMFTSLQCRLLLQNTGSWAMGSVVVVRGLSCSTACVIFAGRGLSPLSPASAGDSYPLCDQGSPGSYFLSGWQSVF